MDNMDKTIMYSDLPGHYKAKGKQRESRNSLLANYLLSAGENVELARNPD